MGPTTERAVDLHLVVEEYQDSVLETDCAADYERVKITRLPAAGSRISQETWWVESGRPSVWTAAATEELNVFCSSRSQKLLLCSGRCLNGRA